MWSGPRNISTAVMRAFENRPDAQVIDEPFYAHWLKVSGADHPMRDAVLAAHDSDQARIIAALLAPLAPGKSIFYQKHMPHHMTNVPLGAWMDHLRHVFLLRDPRRMLASYVQKHPTNMSPETLGFPQMQAVYDTVTERYGPPIVLHTESVLKDPRKALSELCGKLDIPFDDAMLAWPAGPRDSDGIWAAHWYDRVIASTGFAPFDPALPDLPPALEAVAEACQPFYDRLRTQAR